MLDSDNNKSSSSTSSRKKIKLEERVENNDNTIIVKEEDLVMEPTVIKPPRIKVEYKPDTASDDTTSIGNERSSVRVKTEDEEETVDEEKVSESEGPQKIKLENVESCERIVSRDDDTKKKEEAEERRRMKAEYKKIMSGAGDGNKPRATKKTIENVETGDKPFASSSSRSSSSSSSIPPNHYAVQNYTCWISVWDFDYSTPW